MRELHEKASAEIEKQEKLRKRRMAIAEASKTNPNIDNAKLIHYKIDEFNSDWKYDNLDWLKIFNL